MCFFCAAERLQTAICSCHRKFQCSGKFGYHRLLELFLRGIAKYNLGDIRGARQDFDRFASTRSSQTDIITSHSKAVNEYDSALEDLEKQSASARLERTLFQPRCHLFPCKTLRERSKDFDRYIRKEPKDPGAYLNRGASYCSLKTPPRRLPIITRLSVDRFEPESYIRRGSLYAAKGKLSDALQDMNHDRNRQHQHSPISTAPCSRNQDYNASMADLNRVLEEERNALTLYNRSLINAQATFGAMEDMDRVININQQCLLTSKENPSMGRWQYALADYNKAIELYPDFAKAYMNRAYVENMLGLKRASKADYETARKKIAEYRSKSADGEASFADTTRKYSSLLALDADFAKKDFDDELLQHRDIDIRLKPLYKFRLAKADENARRALSRHYENPLIERFQSSVPVDVAVSTDTLQKLKLSRSLSSILAGNYASGVSATNLSASEIFFIKGIYDVQNKQYSSALDHFDKAVQLSRQQ